MPTPDLGNLVYVLNNKGIIESNKTDLSALVFPELGPEAQVPFLKLGLQVCSVMLSNAQYFIPHPTSLS
jgi:hypothetical protein